MNKWKIFRFCWTVPVVLTLVGCGAGDGGDDTGSGTGAATAVTGPSATKKPAAPAASAATSSSSAPAAPADCQLESVKAALMGAVAAWNMDGLAVGTSFKATAVKKKAGSDGVQGTFQNTVTLEILEGGVGSKLQIPVDVDAQKIGSSCVAPPVPTLDAIEARTSIGATGPECQLQAVAAGLIDAINSWNIDGLPIGTTFSATNVTTDSAGVQGTFTNTVAYSILEGGVGSTFQASVQVDVQDFGDHCVANNVH